MQVLPLCILRMSVMLKMPSMALTIGHLAMTGAGCLWSGLRVNVGVIMMVLSLWQTRGQLKLCLLSTLIPLTLRFMILKDILSLMGRCFMSEFVGTLHLCNLRHRKKPPKPYRLLT